MSAFLDPGPSLKEKCSVTIMNCSSADPSGLLQYCFNKEIIPSSCTCGGMSCLLPQSQTTACKTCRFGRPDQQWMQVYFYFMTFNLLATCIGIVDLYHDPCSTKRCLMVDIAVDRIAFCIQCLTSQVPRVLQAAQFVTMRPILR